MQGRLMQSFRKNDLYIAEAYTACFAVFFLIWGTPLRLSLSLIFLEEFIIKHAQQTGHLTVISYKGNFRTSLIVLHIHEYHISV